jgi:hypothetical protein
VVRGAAHKLLNERYLLHEDSDRMIQEAESSEILSGEKEPSQASRAVAARLCAAQTKQ